MEDSIISKLSIPLKGFVSPDEIMGAVILGKKAEGEADMLDILKRKVALEAERDELIKSEDKDVKMLFKLMNNASALMQLAFEASELVENNKNKYFTAEDLKLIEHELKEKSFQKVMFMRDPFEGVTRSKESRDETIALLQAGYDLVGKSGSVGKKCTLGMEACKCKDANDVEAAILKCENIKEVEQGNAVWLKNFDPDDKSIWGEKKEDDDSE